jgi:carboxyl-terminal processing protease
VGDFHRALSSSTRRRRRKRLWPLLGGVLATILVLLVGIWLGGHPSVLPAPLRASVFEARLGAQTYGKGVFQQTLRLVNGGALDITIGRFFTPTGHNLGDGVHQGTGIVPNVEAPEDSHAPVDEALAIAERTVAAEVR